MLNRRAQCLEPSLKLRNNCLLLWDSYLSSCSTVHNSLGYHYWHSIPIFPHLFHALQNVHLTCDFPIASAVELTLLSSEPCQKLVCTWKTASIKSEIITSCVFWNSHRLLFIIIQTGLWSLVHCVFIPNLPIFLSL